MATSSLEERIHKKLKATAEDIISDFDVFHKQTLRDLLDLLGEYARIQTTETKSKAKAAILIFQHRIDRELTEFAKKADYLLHEVSDRGVMLCPKTQRRLDIMRRITYGQLETFWASQGVIIEI